MKPTPETHWSGFIKLLTTLLLPCYGKLVLIDTSLHPVANCKMLSSFLRGALMVGNMILR